MFSRGRALTAVGATLVLGACAGGPATGDPTTGSAEGPGWSAEIEQARSEATTDFERGALADGTVSDQEYQEVRERLVTCLTDLGYGDVQYSDEGEISASFPPGLHDPGSDAAMALVDEQNAACEASSGERTVGRLHVAMRRNPQHLDESTILAGCLVERGAVGPGYTGADLDRDGEAGTGIFAEDFSADFAACNADPLGLVGASD
jgi:hypothetical protein